MLSNRVIKLSVYQTIIEIETTRGYPQGLLTNLCAKWRAFALIHTGIDYADDFVVIVRSSVKAQFQQ